MIKIIPKDKGEKGFTLIEVLIVLTILTMLAAVVIVAVNPARQFAQARNTQRWAAVNSILNAVHQNMIDNRGIFDSSNCPATGLPGTETNIDSDTGADLCDCLAPLYIAELPYDPGPGSYYTDCSNYDAGYTIYQDATTGRITIKAPSAELGEDIAITR